MQEWKSQFANDPTSDYDLYLELIDEIQPQAKIERGADGELYLSLFACPQVRIPYSWLLTQAERAETLPSSEKEEKAKNI